MPIKGIAKTCCFTKFILLIGPLVLNMAKLRYFLRVKDEDRLLCWFDLRADDLYWGSAKPDSAKIAPIPFEENGVTLTVPSDFEVLKGESPKGSYHASGQTHVKLGAEYSGMPYRLPLKTNIKSPLMFLVLLSMPATSYPRYGKKLTRQNAHATVLSLAEDQSESRLCIEFFLTPAGVFTAPQPFLKLKHPYVMFPLITQSLSPELILVARPFVLGRELSKWQPTIEVWFSPDHEHAKK